MKVIQIKSEKARVKKVREIIRSAGNSIFAISFIKRSSGKLRKMSCRRHVVKPQYSRKLKENNIRKSNDYNLLTVFDVNCLKYNKQGKLCGRGGFKSIPLENITRIKSCGQIYKVIS